MVKALRIPEQVAVQYFAFDRKDVWNICYGDFFDLLPSSYKFLLKNKSFQVEAISNAKTCAAIRTLDPDFVKKYLEQVKPKLNDALVVAAIWGFTDAVKILLSDAETIQSLSSIIYVDDKNELALNITKLSKEYVVPISNMFFGFINLEIIAKKFDLKIICIKENWEFKSVFFHIFQCHHMLFVLRCYTIIDGFM